MLLRGKKVIAIGEREGISGPSLGVLAESAGADVVIRVTQCFVWTSAGAMDLEDQAEIQRTAENVDSSETVVLLGQPDPMSSAMFAETVTRGDPTWAGPLAGVSLKLPVFHVLEPEIKAQMDSALYEEHVGLMEMTADVEEIVSKVRGYREPA